ncbi:MAG TPA: electron transfer flavoprotein subunit beta/FixA family protein [Candidatus Thermoplasmatota archaeon]|jgi:electron transfer flavoprotein beta subunit|nr:electron transfer flavoprotein subunit beta/FixA family protein [Candidatus Thermoplasmatota archaeon]
MDIVVCVKRVPETEAGIRLKPDGSDIERSGLAYDLNDFDNYALEEALRIKEKKIGTVTVVTVGGPECDETLRQCLAKGADAAVRAWSDDMRGSDEVAVARILGAAIKGLKHDLVLCGVQSEDEDASVVPPALAEFLNLPSLTVVTKTDVGDGAIKVHRELEGGLLAVVEAPLPALLSIQTGLNEPRLAALRGILAAKSKPITVKTSADLGLAGQVGSASAKTKLVKLVPPPAGQGARMLQGNDEAQAKELAMLLREKGYGRRH